MDVIQQLPFPDEICHKIVLYAFKSPHTGLGVSILKKQLKMNDLDIPEKDQDVTCIDRVRIINFPVDMSIDIYFYTCFYNLTVFDIRHTGVTGDIVHLKSLMNLTNINLSDTDTDVYGDIAHLKSLTNLTDIGLNQTSVTGDIEHLNSLLNLVEIMLNNTAVTGDIKHLGSLSNLTHIDLGDTDVTGDEDAFHEYRKSCGLKECEMWRF